jgi:FkbM family methyltransferase
MQTPSLITAGQPVYDVDLLRALRGCRIAAKLKVLCVIGAHRFDELPLIDVLFPALQHIYLFEPQAGPLEALNALARRDTRIRVFGVAVSDTDGTATFNIASNDGESSSLLKLGSHRELFPEVTMQRTIEVPTRRLDSILAEHRLLPPDLMIVDVQGAEYLVLKSLTPALLDRVRLLYTEVSTEPVYESAGLLSDVEALLSPRFVNVGFAPINAEVPVHGNAVFLARADAAHGLDLSTREWLRRGVRRLKRQLKGHASEPSGSV